MFDEIEFICKSIGKFGMLFLDAAVLGWVIKILHAFWMDSYYYYGSNKELEVLKLILFFIFMAVRANRFYKNQEVSK